MHPPEIRARALELIAAGHNDCEVGRMMGIPRGTIRDWRRPTYLPREPQIPRETCPRCWRSARPLRFTPADYCELLGLYLGDGDVSVYPRAQRLRIVLDVKYPDIIRDAHFLLERCFLRNGVDVVPAKGCVHVSVYSSHLVCLFPQHGPGPKHQRRIALEPWQEKLLEAAPWAFLRGCVRSDGSAFVNRTGSYEYLSYDFCNTSKDIVDLFTAACDLVDVEYRLNRWKSWRVRINRRRSADLMLANVGLKT